MTESLVVTLTVAQLTSIISQIVQKEVKENIPQPPVKYLNAKEAAAIIRCSAPTFRGHVRNGRVPKYQIGRKPLFKLHEVEAAATKIHSFRYK